ncbi:MAG: hypothetical protein MI920_17955, partial [Kiloniellales bacterium]|nr:hypothetical protein [Kiloniellales bacterium]
MTTTLTLPGQTPESVQPVARRNIVARLFPWIVLLVIAAMTIAPLFSLVVGAFSLARLPNEFSLDNMGLANFYAVWVEQRIDRVIWNTTAYVIGATIFGVSAAVFLAW